MKLQELTINLKNIKKEINKNSNKEKAKLLQGFFKTEKGSYGEGDIFLGISVPTSRKIAKEYSSINFNEIKELLCSNYHEQRLIALLILVEKYEIAKKEKNEIQMKKIYEFYLKNTNNINNWDLVDLSCYKIVGDYLLNKKNERKILYKLAKSNKKGSNGWQWLWEKRIAIVSTATFIKNNDFSDTLKLSKIFLNEKHDLMHKAVGWMLREVGKHDEKILIKFLKENYSKLPRTTLRYSIEKFDEKKRKEFLKGNFN